MDAALQAAIASPLRSATNRARDAARHPYETLHFFGLAPSMTVVEAAPGSGWYTEILAPYLRDQGRLLAAHDRAKDGAVSKGRQAYVAKLARDPQTYDRVLIGSMPQGGRFTDIAPPGGADAVLTFRNVHNWIEAEQLDDTLRAFASVLKPGGVLGVEEHRAPAGSSIEWVKRNGYVDEDYLVERCRAVGLRLQAKSDINRNPRDTHDHPNGVWSLPPTLRGGDVDRSRYLAIGESDRFTHRYVKA